VAVLLAVAAVPALAQQNAWTVKQEWVRAHEEFLASDAMQGRGSATHDEQVAATYVASEFMGYGLKPAPGMNGFVQAAGIFSPVLDGHATLAAGGLVLEEGRDFQLIMTPGVPVKGQRVTVRAIDAKSANVPHDSMILLTDIPSSTPTLAIARQVMSRSDPYAIIVAQDAGTDVTYAMVGGKTRVPMLLADGDHHVPNRTLIAVKPEAFAKLKGAAGELSLNVHTVPDAPVRQTYNAIGYLPGSDSTAGTVLLTAHLDHLGIGRPVNGDGLYNGANDDAAGTTAVLELARALANGPKLRRSVLFVCYGSEEVGELGSTYFGAHPPVPLKDLVANLEFEMIGNQDPKMPKGVLLLTGWERSNLGPELKAHGASLGPDPYPEEHFFERSDNYALALKGVVAHTAAGWGTPPTYHQPNDDLMHLDIGFMTNAIQSLVEPVRWLASSSFVPKWNAGGKPEPR
jgi:aminopeptidase YwaD